MATDPYPRNALDANRSGRLTPEQVGLYRAEAASDRRNLLFGGIAVMAFGAIIVVGALTGRIPGGRLEPLAIGAAILAVGVVVTWFGGIRGSRAKAAAADAGRVTSLEGPFRRDRRDRSEDGGHVSPGNEYEYYLLVGDRSFDVSRDQWEAAPEDGVVRVYLLGDSSRIVNLEKVAEAPPPQVPAIVRFALERAAASGGPARSAQARSLLDQAAAMARPAGAAREPASAAPAGPVGQAILGTWQSDLAGITYEFRADGTAVATSSRAGTRHQRWSVAGPDSIRLDDATLQAVIAGDTLSLGEPSRPLVFMRVG